MPRCTDARIDFGRFGRRVIEADFSGGDLSSDGGMLLLRQVDEHLGLSRAAAAAIPDPRDPERITHPLRDLLAQRLYGLCCGYEDLNDPKALRGDALMQTAVGRDEALGSAPTFSRLENRATRAQAWALHEVQAAQFIASHDKPPAELVLDIDASDVPLHGAQELGAFHAYYDHHCYLPLYVFCGQGHAGCGSRPSASACFLWVRCQPHPGSVSPGRAYLAPSTLGRRLRIESEIAKCFLGHKVG
jgi:hypothetical protein